MIKIGIQKCITKPMSKKGSASMAGTAVGIIMLVFLSVIVQKVITNQTADGNITGLSATIAPYVVPLMWVGGLLVAAKLATKR